MKKDNYILHLGLFVATLLTTTIAGSEWVTGVPVLGQGIDGSLAFLLTWKGFLKGFGYSLPFLTFLTVHEFGHYFAARFHRVKCSLPFYIPFFIPVMPINIGTFGAVIRIRQIPKNTRQFFDIGVSGPLAGFMVSVLVLAVGFLTLPDRYEYITAIHPEYIGLFGSVPSPEEFVECTGRGDFLVLGNNLLFTFFQKIFADPAKMPPPQELIHYPLLVVGFFSLFFTALNLLPIGQLDGGHVIYGLFGKRGSYFISRVALAGLLIMGISSMLDFEQDNFILFAGVFLVYQVWVTSKVLPGLPPYIFLGVALLLFGIESGLAWMLPTETGNALWLIYSFLLVRVMGVDHPGAVEEMNLNPARKLSGWLAILVFILSFSPNPLVLAQY